MHHFRRYAILLVIVVALGFWAANAQATAKSLSDVSSWAIDFRDECWYLNQATSGSPLKNKHDFEVNYNGFGNVQVSKGEGSGSGLGWWPGDGLGIWGDEDDEIDSARTSGNGTSREVMTVTIENGILLTQIGLTDLFLPLNGSTDSNPGEMAQVELFGNTWSDSIGTFQTGANYKLGYGNGEVVWEFSEKTPVYHLRFTTYGSGTDNTDNNFSLAALNGAAPVPEPATLVLSGMGLALMAGYLKKRSLTGVKAG